MEELISNIPNLNKRMVRGLVILLILAIGTALGVYLVGQKQIFKPNAAGLSETSNVTYPETSFTLTTDQPKVSTNSLVRVSVYVKTDIDAANLFAVKLKFPADLLQVSTIVTGQKSQCLPKPACLDAKYPCRYPEPASGWCPKVSVPTIVIPTFPVISKIPSVSKAPICAQVITRACEIKNPDNCQDFPTPCDVPDGWTRQELQSVQGISTDSAYFIQDWVEKFYDNQLGTISLIGSVPNPGYQTQTLDKGGVMVDIYFTTKKGGLANILFANDSAIYRNSDNTNILTTKREASLEILPPVIPTKVSILQGDVNGSGGLDLGDMSTLMSKLGQSGANAAGADLNSDGLVNAQDYSALQSILSSNGVIGVKRITIPTPGVSR